MDVPRSEIGVLNGAKVAHLGADLEVKGKVDGHEDEGHETAPPAQEGSNANEDDRTVRELLDIISVRKALTCDAW